ncbi:MAG: antibiotic biosynthesis monooxygenase [Alphaproteobacteria bacterium]|nr:antibiotic biosynthesis monooxygenase [Alphaproteobacteria bacterium]
MIGVVARIKIQEGKAAEAETVLKELVAAVKANEPDVPVYDLFKAKDGSGDFIMLEMYPNQAVLDAHQKTAHFQAVGAKLMPLLAGAPKLEFLDGA